MDHPWIPSTEHLGDYVTLDGTHFLPTGTSCIARGDWKESGIFFFDVDEGPLEGVRYGIPCEWLPFGFLPFELSEL